MLKSYAFRPATNDDASFIYALRVAGLQPFVEEIWGWDDDVQQARFTAMFDAVKYQIVVVAGEDVGALSVVWGEDQAFISDVEIAPAWRSRGLGTRIIGEVLDEAQARKVPVALQVLRNNPARRLYERLGFVVVGETASHVMMRGDPAPIGLARGVVRLAPHHPEWQRLFTAEAARLRAALGERALAVEHVGSTAVAGLRAKPILDIMVGVASLDETDGLVRDLELIGYERRPAGDLPGRQYLVLGEGEVRRVHLSLSEPGSDFWRDHLLFRDRLRADPALAAAYERLKLELAARFPHDRLAYTDGKDAFIRDVLAANRDHTGAQL
jgi:GrpB-like predicted nucleotidyltransferase (UPF0157 family)/GNAT superfamily N-acetyltransferase